MALLSIVSHISIAIMTTASLRATAVLALRVAPADKVPRRLAHSAHRVDHLRALPDRKVPQLQELVEVVVFVVPELDGMEELVGAPGDVGDHQRVVPVVLLLAPPDRAQLPRVPDKHLSTVPARETLAVLSEV